MIKEKKREPLKVLLLILSTNLRTLKPKTRKLLLNKLLERSRTERKLLLPKSKETRRQSTKRSKMLKKLKTKLPKRLKTKPSQLKERNDQFII